MEERHGARPQHQVSSSSGGSYAHPPECRIIDLPPVVILEIFRHLDPRELSVVACVCPLFRILASDSHGWKEYYCERWGLPGAVAPAHEWKQLYVARETRCKALLGRFKLDLLCGHTETVRAVRMVPARNLVVSAGYDSSVRIWDVGDGLPAAWSQPLGETIRAVAVDGELLAVGGSSVVRVWHASPGCSHLFDLARNSSGRFLRGHSGPVTCLGLDAGALYSGSWDMTVKIWKRHRLEKFSQSLHHSDWVWGLVARGECVLSTSGSDAYSWDVETGALLRFRPCVHRGNALAVEGSRTGSFLITGGEDGAVRVFDNRIPPSVTLAGECSENDAVAAWLPHSAAVNSLAFDDPSLVSASADGSIALMDLRHVMRKGSIKSRAAATVKRPYTCVVKGDTVQRMLSSGGSCAYSVDIGSDRIVSAGEGTAIKVWDFSQALEFEKKTQALRSVRREQRAQRKLAIKNRRKE
ncbi:hypothetical protein SELMODRAFT_79926 [Selaginella moellendorffii]|uniref:F-box domain-containing protein n=1 Tax=Selaginella moellendorffii TaxID=88036 RepID=D8QWK8_SELML|nr:F-box/WD-40 repeat-containing protein At5g21040 [Selaginella moellendorffii]EFJ35258.1 hypothetical protein SELMODRAFT_79926 [Selaginella moellendorffii]|eukprot:XP_002963387.1 F-box/WD-40 repeat-containing protein At5g21040 [Selaginella moellendorffii]